MGDFGADDRLDQYWSLQDLRKDLEKIWTLNDISLTTGGPARLSLIHISEPTRPY